MDFLVPHSAEGAEHRRELLEAALTDATVHERVDSGRLAEPFWYVDSELTSPHDERRWPGRPPRGQAPAPVPGVIIPDAPVRDPENPGVTHIRQLCRSGLLVLLADAGQREAAAKALDDVLPPELPRRVVALEEVDTDGILRTALRMEGSREMWLVRPDAHLAACVATPEDLAAATRRLLPR